MYYVNACGEPDPK